MYQMFKFPFQYLDWLVFSRAYVLMMSQGKSLLPHDVIAVLYMHNWMKTRDVFVVYDRSIMYVRTCACTCMVARHMHGTNKAGHIHSTRPLYAI